MNDWRPTADIETLRLRAAMLARTREFFSERGALEVETPALSGAGNSESNIYSVRCNLDAAGSQPQFLHTSPEFAMKRLLAAGAPDIFQICRVFRDAELGRRHLPEFTLLEWYRRDFDLDQIIDETCTLVETLAAVGGRSPAGRKQLTYREAFAHAAGFDPLATDPAELAGHADRLLGADRIAPLREQLGEDRDAWLDLLTDQVVMPAFDRHALVIVTHYPASQAGLSRLDPNDPRTAQRFELFWNGLELANGYRELLDPREQRERFDAEQARRTRSGLPATQIDAALLAALEHGLPDCCGVAVGFDRLTMACLDTDDIAAVVSFATYLTRDTYS